MAAFDTALPSGLQVTYPLDTIRLRLAVDPATNGIRQACSRLWVEAGVKAFYRGIGPSLVGIAPYMALELATFDLLPKEMPGFARGFSAALLATSFCYPLDTIRRQIQVQASTKAAFWLTASNIFRSEGILGFYRGFLPSTLKNLPNKGVRLATFDAVKKVRANGEEHLEREASLLNYAEPLPAVSE